MSDTPLTARANRLVDRFTRAALVVGLSPLPLTDVILLTSLQLKLIHSLSELYGRDFVEHIGKSVLVSLIGGITPKSLSLNVASLAKTIPIYGLVAGMATTSIVGGATTYAVGKLFIQHFESGGTVLTFDPTLVRAYYMEQYKQAEVEVRKNFVGVKP